MTVPRLTMDSKYPGLMLVEVNHNEPCYMTREDARDFGIAVLAMTEQGFMRAFPEYNDDTLGSCGCIDYHMADCPTRTGGSWDSTGEPDEGYDGGPDMDDEDDYALDIREHGKDNDR